MRELILNFYQKYFSDNETYNTIIFISIIAGVIYLIDRFIRFVLIKVVKNLIDQSSLGWDKEFYRNHIFQSLAHLISLSIGFLISHDLFKNSVVDKYIDKFFGIAMTIIFLQLIVKLIDATSTISGFEKNSYRTVAVRTFSQFIKVVILILGLITITSILFNVSFTTLITSISAVTAIFILIFRDTIIGFVSGIQISSSEIMKVGDWVFIEKHNLEGIVIDVNLVTTKIESFDKTISSIPTYDIISTKLKNYQPMVDLNKRRIMRSILFNSNSFRFYEPEKIQELKLRYPLLDNYIEEQKKLDNENSLVPLESEITNIGLFRAYTNLYLHNHPRVSKSEIITVRQLPITEKGVPMEVYCFIKTAIWVEYEKIVSDLFDHLIIVSRNFDLEIHKG